jgi:hypothetical protein
MTAGMLPAAADVYFSKFLVRPFIFRKSKKKYIKNSLVGAVGTWNAPARWNGPEQ